jgi:hypothetical protein
MLKFIQNSGINDLRLPGLFLGLVALTALISAMPVTPALAQVPAGLLRLDPPRPSNDTTRLADDQRTKVRSAYARAKKSQIQ